MEELNNRTESSVSNALGTLLGDPNALSGVAGALKRLGILEGDGESAENGKSAEDGKSAVGGDSPSAQSERSDGGSDSPLSSLLSDPEIMKRIPQLLSLISSASSPQKRDDKRSRLLLALRPYLSERRSNAIDYLLKMSVIGDALKILK